MLLLICLINCGTKEISLYTGGILDKKIATYFDDNQYYLIDKCEWQRKVYCSCDIEDWPPNCPDSNKVCYAYCK